VSELEKTGVDFSFPKAEKEILAFWEKEKIFQKSLKQTEKKPTYIFFDGPPFATGLPHFGHLVGSVLKDIVPRYFTMKGFHVERRFGWDCHGLPIEYEIDKKLGMSAQDAVAQLGIKGYNDECRGIVQRYTREWRKTISRIGRWVDFENDYKTMDPSFMESVWWVFKQLWDKGLIYQGVKVVPFSTALGTVLSNFEAGQNYHDVQDPAVTVLFKLKGDPIYLAAWTTTPWTLPSNLGLCVKADLDYIKVRETETGRTLYLAEARLASYQKRHPLEVLEKIKGAALQGKKYEPLFPYFVGEEKNGAFQVFADDFVTTDTGTGIVHLAPAFGEDDHRIFKEAGVTAIVCPVDDGGKFTQEVKDYAGQYVKDADKNILHNLKERKLLWVHDTIVHSYPYCWRSDTPLIYKSIPTWYVKVESLKDKLLNSNEAIHWVPGHLKHGRFGKWLEGARDWAISRNRFWGAPLPIWSNDLTGQKLCFGSIAELEKLSGKKITGLHREEVDPISFNLKGEEGNYRRIPEVLDCWFESGAMPYAQLHYPFENQKTFSEGFPAEFIAEGLDQTRGWFYTLTVLSTALFQKPAFKNVIVNGIVSAEDGKKMSKRLKNYTEPDVLMENFGADALRLYMINSGVVKAEELRFSDNGVKDTVRRTLLPWYNAFKFFKTYAEVDGWNPKIQFREGNNILDRWILSRKQSLIRQINREMAGYRLYNVIPALLHFIEDLTNWYIRLNRRRFWVEGLEPDKQAAYSTLYFTLHTLNRLMAPFAPFLSEYLFLQMKKLGGFPEASIHLCTYPEPEEKFIDETLEDAVDRMQQVILLGRQKRNEEKVKVKIPLPRLTVIHKDPRVLKEIQRLQGYLQGELNVKSVEYSQKEEKYIKLYSKPNAPVLGKRLGREFKTFASLIQNLEHEALEELENQGEIHLEGKHFTLEDILIFREPQEGTNAVSNRLITIDLNCTLDPVLVEEGLAREVVNRIQRYRKEKGLNVADRIMVHYSGDNSITRAIAKHRDYIAGETLAEALEESVDLNGGQEFDLDGLKVKLVLRIV
jgi:isoleucyl-tRNA synthetase